MSNEDWLTIEKLVQVIEKSLSPGSIVEHNIKLTDLNSSSNRKRQCDIVIKSGESPRETITIVEVQSRKSKFNITLFDGLVQKMYDVGAQHLICVSTTGFSDSIKEKARKLGGTVRLVKLSKNDSSFAPIFVNFIFTESRPIYNIQSPPKIQVDSTGTNKVEMTYTLDDNIFCFDPNSEQVFSAKNIVALHFSLHFPKTDGIYVIKFPYNGINLFIKYQKKFLRISNFECEVKVTIHNYNLPSKNIYSYEQEESGPIAWLIEAKSAIDDNLIRLTVNPGPNGTYIVNGFQYVQHKSSPTS